jgi:hypothetical protein
MTIAATFKEVASNLNQTEYIPSVEKVAAPPTIIMNIQNIVYFLSLSIKPSCNDERRE